MQKRPFVLSRCSMASSAVKSAFRILTCVNQFVFITKCYVQLIIVAYRFKSALAVLATLAT